MKNEVLGELLKEFREKLDVPQGDRDALLHARGETRRLLREYLRSDLRPVLARMGSAGLPPDEPKFFP